MDDVDKALDSLKFQIKKEIVDNYFAARVDLEEDIQDLNDKVQTYLQEFTKLRRKFWALYQALGSESAIAAVMQVLGLKEWPYYQDFHRLPEPERRRLLPAQRPWGLTASRRHRNLVFALYEEVVRLIAPLKEQYDKVLIRLRLINEDVQKFNASFDFGLIAAQIEAMEGGGEVISGGLMAGEREELSTRMRFKRQKLTDEDLPRCPDLPPLQQVKDRLAQVLAEFSP
jgi:hypothetical protein